MLTLSMVDIDKDDYGEPKPHFLIKRAAGVGGDWLVQDRGNMRIRPEGESRWMDEREFNALRGITHNIRRLVNESAYPALEAAGRASAYTALGLEIPPYLKDLLSQADLMGNFDNIAKERARLEVMRGVYPHDSAYSASLAQYNQGFYIPKTRILPLGDNRDNSRDGRSFGPVMASKILGKGSIIYWPGDFRFRRFAALERFGFFK
jgi:signal peptidase I